MSGFLIATVFAVGLLLVLTAKPAHAATFFVNTTGDEPDSDPGDGLCRIQSPFAQDPFCSLRAAIEEANATAEADTINFGIPTPGPHTIAPTSELPEIVTPMTIDGYSESSAESTPARPNTATDGSTNAVLRIALSGANAGLSSGLKINSGSNVVVKGLAINRWQLAGIWVVGGNGHRIEGNFLGTDPYGTPNIGNGGGAVVGGTGNTVGGTTTSPDKRNLISGNGAGVYHVGSNNKIEGNLIGTDKTGTGSLGNTDVGVKMIPLDGTTSPVVNNTVMGNIIAFNRHDGVMVLEDTSTGNRILGNSIFSNGAPGNLALGITLGNETPTPNDRKDPDTGANRLQNYPQQLSATKNADGTMTISGLMDSRPRKTFTLQFFSNPEADPSGFGEGKTFIGETTVKTNRKGKRPFSFTFTPAQTVTAGQKITATATNNSTGDTSEFSAAVSVS
jgi:CSLREA domain-containing protein